jgi:enoyl-CoA hydratase
MENITYTVEDVVAVITVAREKALNALNRATIEEIGEALELANDNAAVRAVILTGAGQKAFIAGADIADMVEKTPREARAFTKAFRRVGDLLENLDKPIIAAVNGFALGGGLEIALACDFIYASDSAKLGQPEVNLGIIPGFGGTQRLARRVNSARAMELIVTGDIIGADEAHRIGLVNKVFPAAELLAEAKKTAHKIAQKGPLAVAHARRAVRKSAELNLPAGIDYEGELFALLFASEDQKEGMRAFLGKRAPQFKGR